MFGSRRMHGRLPLLLAIITSVLVAIAISATTAHGGVLEDQLKATRSQAHADKQQLTVVQRRQQVIVLQITALNAKLRAAQQPVDELNGQIVNVNARIDGRRRHIAELKIDFVTQKGEIATLEQQLGGAREELTQRVVETYKSGNAGAIEELAGAGSLRNLLDRQEAIGQAVGLDQHVIDRITDTQRDVRLKRASNHQVQHDIQHDIEKFQADRAELETARVDLQRKVDTVASVKHDRDAVLHALNSQKQTIADKLEGAEGDEKVLKQVIETGQVTYSGQVSKVSPAGLIWPVNGPISSPFGMRWGKMHDGIDIVAGTGTPIHAAATGIVVYASWEEGYGNFTLIEHGGNLFTAYGHQSKIAVHVGEPVQQGQVIGFVGCTGHCTGPHLHFETRHGTVAVDPMQYL